jgi:hypothetical protein
MAEAVLSILLETLAACEAFDDARLDQPGMGHRPLWGNFSSSQIDRMLFGVLYGQACTFGLYHGGAASVLRRGRCVIGRRCLG